MKNFLALLLCIGLAVTANAQTTLIVKTNSVLVKTGATTLNFSNCTATVSGSVVTITPNTGSGTSAGTNLLAYAGTAAIPSISFAADPDTGFYRFSPNIMIAVAGGSNYLLVGNSTVGVQPGVNFFFQPGSASAPGAYISGDSDSGFYQITPGNMGWTMDGVPVLSVTNTGFTFLQPIIVPGGSASAPGFTFTNDTDTGIFRSIANIMGFAAGGSNYVNVGAGVVGIQAGVKLFAQPGTVSAPGFYLSGDSASGLYQTSSGIAMAAGGGKSAAFNTNGFEAVNLLVTGSMVTPAITNAGAASLTINLTNQTLYVSQLASDVQLITTGRVAGARCDVVLFNTNASASVTVTYQSLWRNCGLTNSTSLTNYTLPAGKCWTGNLLALGSGSETNVIVTGGLQGN